MREVARENLQKGKSYYIECLTYDKSGNIIRNKAVGKRIANFVKLQELPDSNGLTFTFFENYRPLQNNMKHKIFMGYDVQLNLLWRFYESSKPKIQENMEKRALDTILIDITGDEWFRW